MQDFHELLKGEKFFKKDGFFFQASGEIAQMKNKRGRAGVLLGYEKKNVFHPTQYLLQKKISMIKDYVIISDEVEFLFTCGRDLFEKSVLEKKGISPFVVINRKKEVLGIAAERGKIYKNIINIGFYFKENEMKEVLF